MSIGRQVLEASTKSDREDKHKNIAFDVCTTPTSATLAHCGVLVS